MMSKKVKQTQTCRLCNETKPLKLFEKDKRVKGGVTTRCKPCKAGLNDRARTFYAGLKYRAQKGGQALEVTLKEIQALYAAFNGKCVYCGADEDEAGSSHHIDHFIAVSEGGTHHISNLLLACQTCNLSKGNDSFIEFYLRKKDEISDENFTTLTHYLALISEQPVDDILKDYTYQYIKKTFGHLEDFLEDEDFKTMAHEIMETKQEEAS